MKINSDIKKAKTLPSSFYTSDTLFKKNKLLFENSCQFVCHKSELNNISCYPFDLFKGWIDIPLLISKQGQKIRCLSNVCTHRGNILCKENVNKNKIICNYHGRTFNLDGTMGHAPGFEAAKNFPSKHDDLQKIDLFDWNNLLFINTGNNKEIMKGLDQIGEMVNWYPFKDLSINKISSQTTFEQLQNRLDEKTLSNKLTNFYNKNRKSKFKKIKAAIQLLFISNNDNIKTHYTYFGRKKSEVLFKEIKNLLKFWCRQRYIDNSFSTRIPETKPIIFFPLQQEPERSLLISAPNYTDQMKTIDYISSCIPDDYILLVKEHPTQGPGRGWRNLSDYKSFKNNPKVKFIHPSVSATSIIKKSKLVISVSGTTSLESSFINKPSITFVKNNFTLIPSIQKLNSKHDLPKLIQDSLQKTADPQLVGKYFDILEEQSFIFDYLNFQLYYHSYFYFDGNLVDVEIDESKMLKFLLDHEKSFSVIIEGFKQKINNYKKN